MRAAHHGFRFDLRLGPSSWLTTIRISAMALSLLAITLTDLTQNHVWVLLNVCVCGQIYQLAEHWFWPPKSLAVKVCYRAGRYWVSDAQGCKRAYELRSVTIRPFGIGLRLHSKDAGPRQILVLRDSVDAQSFRRAKVWLRFAHA